MVPRIEREMDAGVSSFFGFFGQFRRHRELARGNYRL